MEKIVEFTLKAKEDIDCFKTSGQTGILKKIRQIVEVLPARLITALASPNRLNTARPGFGPNGLTRSITWYMK